MLLPASKTYRLLYRRDCGKLGAATQTYRECEQSPLEPTDLLADQKAPAS